VTRKRWADDRPSAGQVEAAACDVITRFHRDVVGRGPDQISASLQGDCLFVHLRGVLTRAEETLRATDGQSPAQGEALIRTVRDEVVRRARDTLLDALSGTIGRRTESLLHDIAPDSDEEMFVVTFADERTPRLERA